MFDIGFTELLLIAIITLVVMGPERMPQMIRSLSLWVGRARQTFSSAKRELEREVGMDDIRQQLHNEKIMRDIAASKEQLGQLKTDIDSAVGDNQDRANDPATGGQP
ncbi:twin-arginine translocase subunit TatB [Gammaproteobacteria bacterium LSUCC0057]|uniref:Sec-independent protein translocase protein TatB n=1 Tax=Gammaproteobacteria bacterium LSUCC0057 TaxID=2559237 RepID=A0A4Y8UKL1_9GAMM|nr:twin-arginine translocase subunit TatB [Gammaproteobacteria bacterium LSUCC0057]